MHLNLFKELYNNRMSRSVISVIHIPDNGRLSIFLFIPITEEILSPSATALYDDFREFERIP